jgi:hypothetical protein
MSKTKKILYFQDRIILPSILPSKGKFEDLITAEDIITKCRISQEEIEEYDFKSNVSEQGYVSTQWNDKGANATFTYNFTDLEKALIKKQLENLNSKNELESSYMNLYKEFVLK